MANSLVFSRTMQGELPFSLNLPEGNYSIKVDGLSYNLSLLQKRVAVPNGATEFYMVKSEAGPSAFPNDWDTRFKINLRTITYREDTVQSKVEDLQVPNEEDLLAECKTRIVKSGEEYDGPEGLDTVAKQRLTGLDEAGRDLLVEEVAIKLKAAEVFSKKDVDKYCEAINCLVRLYMVNFNDPFVQEVTESFFSKTIFDGILVEIYCNGNKLENFRQLRGSFAHVFKGPWFTHPDAEVEAFRSQLESDSVPDPVKLLNIRARSLLERGAYRSAIIEASAAFDLCLTRKVRAGLASQGRTDLEIDEILKKAKYKEKAKAILKDAVGFSAYELAPEVWNRFVTHRDKRGKVAHAAEEPYKSEATQAVEDMVAMTNLIDGLPDS